MSGSTPTPPGGGAPGRGRPAGFELKLEHGRAIVRLGEQVFLPGVRLVDLQLEVPDVRFPFDVGAGASQFRQRLCDLLRVELVADDASAAGFAARLAHPGSGLAGLQVSLRAGFAEVAGRLEGGPAFTLKVGVEPEGEHGLRLLAYAPRLYGPGPLAEASLPFLLGRAAAALGRAEGAALACEPLAPTLRRLLPPRGWKLPRAAGARLSLAAFEPGRLRLAWDRGDSPPTPAADPDLLEAVEGARAFADAEGLLAAGDAEAAREALLRRGPAATGHPFAAGRLLSLLSADERFHDEALDLAESWLARRADFAPALLAEARVRASRGEVARASELLSQLASAAARRGEELSAIAAADACLAHGPRAAPAAAVRAVEVALSIRRDHLPALRALLQLGERGGDREALLRACRRLAAYSDDDGEKAAAHATLGRLLLRADPAAARLHLDHALRLSPDHPDTAEALARACEEAGEHLRALRAWDRARELRIGSGDRAGAARAAAAVGALWETQLLQPENALLRYREAAELDPSPEANQRAARLAGSLGHWAEAADRWSAVLAGASVGAPGAAPLMARARRELARIAEERLSDAGRAAEHLEAALELEPDDPASLLRLAELYRQLSRPSEQLGALERLAARTPEPAARARLLTEAARLAGAPAEARRRWEAVLALAPQDPEALRALADAAGALSDRAAEREALSRLAALPLAAAEVAAVLDRLARTCEGSGDLPAALDAASSARRAELTAGRLAAELRLAGRIGGPVLAAVRAAQAQALAPVDPAEAARSWLEHARLVAASGSGGDEAALESLAEARLLAPDDPAVLEEQAALAERCGDLSLALSALEPLAEQRPEDGSLAMRMARAALGVGDRDLALAQAERAEARGAPEAGALRAELLTRFADPEAATARVAQALERADPAERLPLLRQALELDPESVAALRALAAEDLAPLLGPARAEILSRLAAHPEATAPEAARAQAARARGLLAAGDRAGALEAAREAARRDPGDAAALDLWAEVAAGLDPAAGAEALLARAALAREAGDPDAPLRLAAAGHVALAAGLAPGGRSALAEALRAGLDREDAVAAWQALAGLARDRGEGAAEREALEALAPLLPTGEKPAALLRLAALRAEAGEAAAAREAAELAHRLAPRDPAAAEACLAAAEGAGDAAALAQLLGEVAELEPARAGECLLRRARLLFGPLGRPEEGDADMARALSLLPPDPDLASEHVRLRREAFPSSATHPWSEPLEALGRRLPEGQAARPLREAAGIALAQGDAGAALRCARRAFARSKADPAFAGPLLARLLYRQGASVEALAVHRRLLGEPGLRLEEHDRARLLRQLAELAEEVGEIDLSLQALGDLVRVRPLDADAALALFRLDPDRRGAVRDLAERASSWRSARQRAGALATAAAAAGRELGDPALADALWQRARGSAGDVPRLLAAIERRRLDALRADADPAGMRPPRELLDALRDAAAACQAAGDLPEEAALCQEAAELAARHGLADDELRERRRLGQIFPGDPLRALAHGLAASRAGFHQEAVDLLRRALELAPDTEAAGPALSALSRSRLALGDAGGAMAAARQRAERARASSLPAERLAALEEGVALVRQLGEGAGDVDLLELLAAWLLRDGDPRGDAFAEQAVAALGRSGENARAAALLALASRAASGERRAWWLRRLADTTRARGDQAAARSAVAEALLADPSDGDLRQAHLAELQQAGETEALARALEEALPIPGADRAGLLLRLALARARLGDEAGAERAERELLDLGPAAPGWQEAAGSLERRWAQRGDHRDLAELRLRRAEAAGSGRERAAILASASGSLLAAGDRPAARATANRACDADPDAPEPWRALALVEAEDGKPGEAAAAHLAAALRSEGAAAAAEALEAARLFEAAGRADDAARAYAVATVLVPGSPPARRALAARAAAAGELPEAARHLAALDPELLRRHERHEHALQLARAYAAAGLETEAAEAWAALFEADAGDAEVFEKLAAAARRAGDRDAWLRLAARHDGALAAGDPTRRRDLRCARAAVLEEMGQVEAAEGAWQAALAIDPDHRPALTALRRLAERRGDRATAADLAAREAALARWPDEEARLWLEEARLRRDLEDVPGTVAALERAVRCAEASEAPQGKALAAEARRVLAEMRPPAAPLDEEVTRPIPPLGPGWGLEGALASLEAPAPKVHPRLPDTLPDFPPPLGKRSPAPAEAAPEPAIPEAGTLSDFPPPLEGPGPAPAAAAPGPAIPEPGTLSDFAPPLERPGPAPAAAAPGPAIPEPGTLSDFAPPLETPGPAPGEAEPEPAIPEPGTLPDFAPPLETPGPAPGEAEPEPAIPEPGTLPDFPPFFDDAGSAPAAKAPPSSSAPDAGTFPDFPPLPDLPPLPELPPPIDLPGMAMSPATGPAAEGEDRDRTTLSFLTDLPPAPAPRAETSPPPELNPAWERDSDPAADDRLRAFAEASQGLVRAEALLALSRRLERRGEQGPAADALAAAAEADPDRAEAILPGLLALVAGDETRTLAAHRLRVRLAPSPALRVGAMVDLGRQLGARPEGRTEAVEILERALGLEPSNGLAAEALSRVFIALGAPDRALTLLSAFEEGAPGLPPRAATALALEAARASGDMALALEKARRAARAAPMEADFQEWWARAADDAGAREEAIEAWNASLAAQRRAPPADEARRRRGLAAALEAAGQLDQARRERLAAEQPPEREVAPPAPAAPEEPAALATPALEPALQRARRQPAEPAALEALARACAASPAGTHPREVERRAELARLAGALAAFVDPRREAPPPPPLPARISPEIRQRAAIPAARGPAARLLSLLAPWLEQLFPADLSRRGVGPQHRLGPRRAPALAARLGVATRALAARPVVAFLADAGYDVGIENTQPPSLVIGAQLSRELPERAMDFALARALCLAEMGWALVGKFSPRDVGVLCELACRFAGAAPPALGLPAERSEAFLEALGRLVPPTVREHAGPVAVDAAAELRGLSPRELQLALRRTGSRQALLWSGDLLAALEALGASRRRAGYPDPLSDRVRALGDPDLSDLAVFALSDLYLELRLAVGLPA
jgi:tetratricopeptide (TPR) repeat protein